MGGNLRIRFCFNGLERIALAQFLRGGGFLKAMFFLSDAAERRFFHGRHLRKSHDGIVIDLWVKLNFYPL